MGIKTLWKSLSPITTSAHLSDFKGMRVGVDGFCWMHKAVLTSVMEIVSGKPAPRFVRYIVSRVEMMQQCGLEVVMVFDGAALPMKRGTNEARRASRAANREQGLALLAQGSRQEAMALLEKSIDIPPGLVKACVEVLRRMGVECIVAPYEADAQLGYLSKEGHVQAVVSEDSDLLVYYTSCVLSKVDAEGYCDCVRVQNLPKVMQFNSFTREMFVVNCIMAGCDYLASLPNVGFKTAHKLIAAHKTLQGIEAALRGSGLLGREVAAYMDELHRVLYCFNHHLVYDPSSGSIVPFSPFGDGVSYFEDILGERVTDPTLTDQLCRSATLNPKTREPFDPEGYEGTVQQYASRYGLGQSKVSAFVASKPFDSTAMRPGRASGQTKKGTAVQPASEPVTKDGSRIVVRSKYFSKNLPVLSEVQAVAQDTDVGEGYQEAVNAVASTAPSNGLNACDGAVDGIEAGVFKYIGCDSDPSSANLSPLSSTQLSPTSFMPPPPSQSQQQQQQERSPNGATCASPVTSEHALALQGVPCPHGYLQCGVAHSIFFRCSEGKNWTQHVAGHHSTERKRSRTPERGQRRGDAGTGQQPRAETALDIIRSYTNQSSSDPTEAAAAPRDQQQPNAATQRRDPAAVFKGYMKPAANGRANGSTTMGNVSDTAAKADSQATRGGGAQHPPKLQSLKRGALAAASTRAPTLASIKAQMDAALGGQVNGQKNPFAMFANQAD